MRQARHSMLILLASAGLTLEAHATDVPALLQWSHRVELATPVSGVVQSVNVEAGQRVKKGQALAILDPTTYRANAAEMKATVDRNQEDEQDAKRNLDRVQELYKRTVIASSELEAAQTRYVRAKTQREEAQARLARARKTLDEATLRAPFDAWVLERRAEPGQAVASQLQPQALFVLARADEMLARASISLAQIQKLKVGDSVTVEVNQKNYPGKIKTLGLEPVKNEANYPLDVAFAVTEQLRAGSPATLKLP